MRKNIYERFRLSEDIAIQQTNIESTNGNDTDKNAPKTYAEYLDTQVKAAQQNKIDFSKADPAKIQKLGKNYATVAKTKFSNLDGLPKNDTEANNMLQTSIQKNAMEKAADGKDTREADEAQKEIDNIQKDLVENTMKKLSLSAQKLIERYSKDNEDYDPNFRFTSAGILVLNRDTGECVICHPTPIYAMNKGIESSSNKHWGIPKGQLEKDEDPVKAAIREFEEETSVHIDEKDISLLGKYFYSKDKDVIVYLYECDDIDAFVSKCKCDSTFEKWGKTWYEVDNFGIYNLKKNDSAQLYHLSRHALRMMQMILEEHGDLLR